MWYIRKKNMNEWEHIILQEDKTETMANLGCKITIHSKITYHLTESAKTFDIICQISSLFKCGSDWYLLMNPYKQIRVHVNQKVYLKLKLNLRQYIFFHIMTYFITKFNMIYCTTSMAFHTSSR